MRFYKLQVFIVSLIYSSWVTAQIVAIMYLNYLAFNEILKLYK
jgi:hypothetical protein